MKKFSKILENNSNEKHYKVFAKIQLIIPAENEGEAGYISDSILASVENNYDYTIDLIEETDERISESFKSNIKKEIKGNDYQMVAGIIDILKKVKDEENRIEIAKDMISQFKREDIKFNYDDFLNSLK
jgi:hypothetical protein